VPRSGPTARAVRGLSSHSTECNVTLNKTPPRHLRRRENVESSEKTKERTAAADWIEENIIDEVDLPIQYTELERMAIEDLGEEDAWSRQHFTNVVKWYFEPVDDRDERNTDGQNDEGITVESSVKRDSNADIGGKNGTVNNFPPSAIDPKGYDTRSYLRGFADGYEAALQQERNE
jgi:hypothetical protein